MSAYIPTLYDNVTLALLPFGAEVLFYALSYKLQIDFIQYKVITHRCVDRKDV